MIAKLLSNLRQRVSRDATPQTPEPLPVKPLASAAPPGPPAPDFLQPGDLVFDVGANIGRKADDFLAWGANVVCVEPQPECSKVLREKYQANPKVIVLEAGLGERPGRLELSVCSEAPTISTFSEHWKHGRFANYNWDKTAPVEVTTLDRLIRKHGLPQYCKIDVEGFELAVLKGLTHLVPCLSFEFAIEFLAETRACLEYLQFLGYREFNLKLGEAPEMALSAWTSAEQVLAHINSLTDADLWGDIYTRRQPGSGEANSRRTASARPVFPLDPARDVRAQLQAAGLWQPTWPLRLHLGCGEQYFAGYLNLDFPPSQHNVMQVKADACVNILALDFPDESVDQVRLHHVFEHFNRVTALAQLIKWHRWLRVGGEICLETPDLMGSARTLLSGASLEVKMGVARHLAGDQADAWAYHIDHWFPERFEHTLKELGFDDVELQTSSWSQTPFLSNVTVRAVKARVVSPEEQLRKADGLLWESTVAEAERPTWEVWTRQLRAVLVGALAEPPINVPAADAGSNRSSR
jgi:FkbM family methyltransferase